MRGSGLGNFLSGMETPLFLLWGVLPVTLETSLVEWKPVRRPRRGVSTCLLGNFLSGMETRAFSFQPD